MLTTCINHGEHFLLSLTSDLVVKKLEWTKFIYPIEYKDAKKTNKMSYPRFTKIIIDYFMSNDPSIPRRNKMFWHTARDATMFTSMRCISKHKDTQVYGTILLTELTNQAMLESKAYQTYYTFASGEKTLKPKYIRKKADSETPPKKKPVQAAKGTRLKSKAKMTKPDKKEQPTKKTKAKGLAVLFEVSLTEAKQIKLATKRRNKDFHGSHVSGSSDGVDTQSKVPDEQQRKTSGIDEGTDKDNENNSDDLSDDGDNDDHDDDSDEERIKSDRDEIPDLKLTNVDQTEHEELEYDDEFYEEEEENIDDEETMYDEEDDEVTKVLYDDVNVNLGNEDTNMTIADQDALDQQNVSQESGFEQVEEDAHVTLTPLLNLENPSPADNEIASLLETSSHHATAIPEITSGFTTTTPPPTPFFNPLLQQQTPTFTTTTSTNPIVTLPEIPNFASVFKFDQRVSALESKMFELRQTNQFASKMKEAVDVAVQLQTNKLREEAWMRIENLSIGRLTIKTINKKRAEVLVRSTNQPRTAYAVAASMSEFELKKILIDKMEANKSINRPDNQKNLYNALVESYNFDKDIITSYGDVVLLKRGRDDQDKDKDPSARSDRGTKRRKSGKDVESSKDSRSKEKKSSNTSKDASQSKHKSSSKSVHVDEPSHSVDDSGMQQDQEFITRIVIQRRVEDLQLGVESYQKKLNLTKPDTYRSNLRNKTAHTSHSDPHGMIYVDQFKRKTLIKTDELHKFSDGTLNDVQTTLHDIAVGKRMEYLSMRKWSNLDKKRARVMVQDIDKQNYQRRLMRNLEKFVGVFPTMATARRRRIKFIAACSYSIDIHKDIMKAQGNDDLVKGFGYLECWAFQIRLAKLLFPYPFAKPCKSFRGTDQNGSRVSGCDTHDLGRHLIMSVFVFVDEYSICSRLVIMERNGVLHLSKRKFVVVCHEKVGRIPLKGGEILRVHGERTLGAAKALMNVKSKEEHELHLKLVLESLRKEKLYAKFSKCDFGRKMCIFLVTWRRAVIGGSSLIGPEFVQEMIDKVVLVKEKPKAARDHQKSYMDKRRKPLEFEVEVFGNANLHVPLNEFKIDKTLCFIEEPIEIMDREGKSLKLSRIPLVKVHWNSKRGPEFT
ncbi:hypothetical protein Tco_1081999 [Tanacetum coccineum]|uniref:Reverse transcriptase domain-containing protein n=1 Tax=Tanacetum coccineum TaxID=301880 RepID=A0ABQ5I014_9ASTR